LRHYALKIFKMITTDSTKINLQDKMKI